MTISTDFYPEQLTCVYFSLIVLLHSVSVYESFYDRSTLKKDRRRPLLLNKTLNTYCSLPILNDCMYDF